MDSSRARVHGVLRADREFLQALRRHVVGADAARVESRQSHGGIPGRLEASASSAGFRARMRTRTSRSRPSLASGLDGIRHKIEPPPVFTGDVYAAQHLPRVPYSLGEAVETFAASEFVAETLGKDVADALHALLSQRVAGVRQGRNRLGAEEIFRKDMSGFASDFGRGRNQR